MDLFSFITLAGGVAFFLYGMNIMSSGLEKIAGGKLEAVLKKMTSNPFASLALGAGITIAIQSSSAMTVMLVGLVNSGIMKLGQTIGLIMGSNIGTTLTAWLMSLVGIESSNVFVQLLKPKNFAPIFAVIGILMIMASKNKKRKDVGSILLGFSILMCGMELMSGAVSPLAEVPEFSSIAAIFENPFLGVLVGTVFTGVIQSSAASVGILQALSLTGSITFGMALPIIMGQNIGTCVTAVLSSIGVNRNAKRVAVVHMSFNIIGTLTCLFLFYGANAIFRFPILHEIITPFGVAVCHSIFNVFTTALLFPFTKQLEKFAYVIIPDDTSEKETYTFLDERLLSTPSFAIAECGHMVDRMADLAESTLQIAMNLIENFNEDAATTVRENEDRLDTFEDKIGSFLVRVASKNLSHADSHEVSRMLHVIGDLERIGDHALNLTEVAREIHEKQIQFSDAAKQELGVLTEATEEILALTMRALTEDDASLAARIEPLEEVIDDLTDMIRMRHIERLQKQLCTIELGFVLADLLNNFERISDHCSNIGVCVIEIKQNAYDAHEYLHNVKEGKTGSFREEYKQYSAKYRL